MGDRCDEFNKDMYTEIIKTSQDLKYSWRKTHNYKFITEKTRVILPYVYLFEN